MERKQRSARGSGAARSRKAPALAWPLPTEARRTPLAPTSLALVDVLSQKSSLTIEDYVAGVSEYVRKQSSLTDGQKKSAQIRLSNALAKALLQEFRNKLASMSQYAVAGEIRVAGALRAAQVDLVEFHPLDGLRLAVEIKPVNLAVGRAIWNRFGDVRVTAVNLHLKFPFSVVGGVLAIPTYEEAKRGGQIVHKDTTHLILRAIDRFDRAGGRRSEAEAAHLLEGVCVIAYNPETGRMEPDLPPRGRGLRWDEFIDEMVVAYEARFGTDVGDVANRLDANGEP